jgi:pyruvate formate lyase activating enzyme
MSIMLQIAKEAKKEGLYTSINSNGSMQKAPLQKYTHGDLSQVLQNLILVKKAGVHLEVANLVIPTINDKTQQIKKMCEWIKEKLRGRHTTAFYTFLPLGKMPQSRKGGGITICLYW